MLKSHWRLIAVYGDQRMERVAHPRKIASGTSRRVAGTVTRPDFIEAMIHTVAVTRRVSRMTRTGRWVVPPLISGAKIARPPRRRMGRRLTGKDPWDGMGAHYSAQQPRDVPSGGRRGAQE